MIISPNIEVFMANFDKKRNILEEFYFSKEFL
jgi:hypothetical protein